MYNNNANKFIVLERNYKSFRRKLPRKVAITAVNFFKRNFKVKGFVGKSFQPWDKRKNPRAKSRLMVQSGTLRRGIKKLKVSRNRVVVGVGSNIKYAKIHNEGGKIPITPKMRRYFWAMHYKTGNDYYKNLALTKKTHLDIPQRQFIGDSEALETTMERMIIKELKHAMK